ncbi:phasin family protein [Thauera linaloolentis]|uniref:Phasin family protein n=1 Tax=Thauera linaloolentis (strain DSM 12138 / JCM 21573 / CCUG 41526 / CIP 105981 / IAM 15112 / NBRC 102519 / 47Lol) TaxID=1123367 RepID=N6ZCF5_THAL4|nr:phasin family protein [Thauera linaloolentis]ENO89844.1 phasin family protein [Thauera linaloolentis 47Lol = DSM 12138]MCM8564609.1 phasin family protein [Thauera linaloolentis]
MTASPEKILATFKTTAEARVNDVSAASDSLLSTVEHLTALNLNTTRSILDDTIALSQAALAVRDPRALAALQLGTITPALQKGFAYAKAFTSVASQSQAELLKLAEAGMSQWLQSVIVALEGLNRNVPVGSDLAVRALKTAVVNASSAYEGATQLVKQVSEAAQANVDQAAAATVDAVSKGTTATATLLKSAA